MNDDRLDGNAVAGLLAEVFPFEMTLAKTVCASCGALDRVGALLVSESRGTQRATGSTCAAWPAWSCANRNARPR